MVVKRTVWFDITEIKDWSGHFTGIQRVIFSLGQELVDNPYVKFCRYDRRRNAYIETEYEFNEPEYTVKTDGNVKVSKNERLKNAVKRYIPTSIKRVIKSSISYSTPPYISTQPTIEFKKDDTLFIAGAFWIGPIEAMRAIAASIRPKVIAVMYDMVPVVMPQFCTEVTVTDFKREIRKALPVVDEWIAISENTKKDLVEYSKKYSLQVKASKIDVIKLGSDINKDGETKSPFTKGNDPKDFLLFVSTIESRKNQILIYQAVKRAEELNIKLPTIVLAGKHGWHSDDLISILQRDEELDGKILWLNSVDDRSLRWLYKHCLFTVYPSVYEGWGLPVAESLAYGKLSVASNSSSIPEVAGNLIEYFSPYSVDEFLEKIAHYTTNETALREKEDFIKKFEQPTWQNTAKIVKEILNI